MVESNQRFTIEQLRSAGTSERAWVAIRGKVYDVTEFAARHPGGRDFLMATVGRDATAMFESLHDPKAIKVLAKRQIGTLIESDMPQYPTQTPFQVELRKNVADYFKRVGKHPRNAPWMIVPYAVSIGVYFTSYFIMFSPTICRELKLLPWIAALFHGWSSAMIGLYLLHDGCHASFTQTPLVWDIMRRISDLLTGLSSHLWIHEHVLGHHPFTNVVDFDPDVLTSNAGIIRYHESQAWLSLYSWQSYYIFPLYAQAAFKRQISEWYQLFVDRKFKNIPINPLPLKEYLWGGTSFLSFITLRLVLPYYFLKFNLLRIFLTYACCNNFWSLYLTFVFQASRVTDEVTWPKPDKGNQMQDWAKLQIESSMDFAHGSWFTTFMVGSLNYQAVHHLLPYVSQYYYPALAPIVQQTCAKYNVKYNLRGSLYEALALHIRRLAKFSTEPGAGE
ncbi:related to Delta(5) fatty acid desaturase [Phialocephala subalpina]|uniref:Delta 8-(E)-sphingolipid desaturase n=1 Tax=Phialocephala subalpina TaxID=576137 RepID=A0A1L7XFM1_9HELO|nr:related to Delta(5) fatty acid desaturase [Phialocephala subalpina]